MFRYRLSTLLLLMTIVAVFVSWQFERNSFEHTLRETTEAQQLLDQIGDLIMRKRESGTAACDVTKNLDRWLVLHVIDLHEHAETMNEVLSMLDRQESVVDFTFDIFDCLGFQNADDYFESLTVVGAPRGKYATYADNTTAAHQDLRRFVKAAGQQIVNRDRRKRELKEYYLKVHSSRIPRRIVNAISMPKESGTPHQLGDD